MSKDGLSRMFPGESPWGTYIVNYCYKYVVCTIYIINEALQYTNNFLIYMYKNNYFQNFESRNECIGFYILKIKIFFFFIMICDFINTLSPRKNVIFCVMNRNLLLNKGVLFLGGCNVIVK